MAKGLGRSMPNTVCIVQSMEITGTALKNAGTIEIGFVIIALIVVAIVGCIVGYLVGCGKIFKGLPSALSVVLFNMDNYVIMGSLILLIFSIYFSTIGGDNAIAVVTLNIFSSVVFSWLLTKKTSIKDFKEKEEELALRSYRHINYIESAANTASGTIDNYISEHSEISTEMQLILRNAKEQIKYIDEGRRGFLSLFF